MSDYRFKKRVIHVPSENAQEQLIIDGALINTANYPSRFSDYQETTSEGHGFYSHKKGVNRDLGGPFLTRRTYIKHGGKSVSEVSSSGGITRIAKGMIFANYNSREYSNASVLLPASSQSELNAYGTTLMSRALPTNPLSGMGQFLGELKDVKSLWDPLVDEWHHRANFFKAQYKNKRFWADNYLNYQFGWLPFVSDIVKFSKVVTHLTPQIQRYDRDSGRRVRRRRSFPDIKSAKVTNYAGDSYGAPTFTSPLYLRPGKLSLTEEFTIRRWFSGSFTYYLPPLGDKAHAFERSQALASKLYGLNSSSRVAGGTIDPELLWNLAPWSWAADWLGNAGDVIHNWQAFQNDSLVCHYGYIMEQNSVVNTWALNGLTFKSGRTVNLEQVIATVTKTRQRATPFGFGLNPVGFSNKQWSIIAALGISKSPRSLRNN